MNFYSLILALVAISGVGVSLWGWLILRKSRKIRQWPQITGIIETSTPCSVETDSLPIIIFSYQVNDTNYQSQLELPEGTLPLPEFTKTYNDKYPVGAAVEVFYNPQHPETATLEPGNQGDWMVLALGIAMIIGGVLSLLFA